MKACLSAVLILTTVWTPSLVRPHAAVGYGSTLVRRINRIEVRMKESYGKGIASHPDPESCAGRRKALAKR